MNAPLRIPPDTVGGLLTHIIARFREGSTEKGKRDAIEVNEAIAVAIEHSKRPPFSEVV